MPTGRRLSDRLVPAGFLALLVTFIAVGWREITNSSTFQLFGDYIARIETAEKVVALTFDDGPHPQHTMSMLDLLDRHGVKATFFMMGQNIERFPGVARQVIARGHEVGNHSYSHPRLVWMSPGRVRDEIERTDRLLRQIGAVGPAPFRPPHAAKFIILPAVLTRMHRFSVLGDVDPEEWKGRPAEVMIPAVLGQVRPGSILGFHEVLGGETFKTVDGVVGALLANGYRFETISVFVKRRPR